MRPKAIIDQLNLLRPIYKKTACFGHFGREEPEFTWEKTDKADYLRKSWKKQRKPKNSFSLFKFFHFFVLALFLDGGFSAIVSTKPASSSAAF